MPAAPRWPRGPRCGARRPAPSAPVPRRGSRTAARFDGPRSRALALRLRHLDGGGRFFASQLHVEQLLADVAADDPHHLAEDHEAFLLVLLLGILLAVAAQTDALAERLHR